MNVDLALQIYKLKMEYGRPIAIYHLVPGAINHETGERTTERIKYPIKQAVVVPNKFDTSALYSSSYLKAARDFAYGNYTDTDIKDILIDTEDFPLNLELEPEDYVVISHEKYQFVRLQEYEQESNDIRIVVGYLITVKRLPGEDVNEVYEIHVQHNLRLTERCADGQ